MNEWLPLTEIIPGARRVQAAPAFLQPASPKPAEAADESVGELVGQMGCGCLLWLGLAALTLGGGINFPLHLFSFRLL